MNLKKFLLISHILYLCFQIPQLPGLQLTVQQHFKALQGIENIQSQIAYNSLSSSLPLALLPQVGHRSSRRLAIAPPFSVASFPHAYILVRYAVVITLLIVLSLLAEKYRESFF